MKANTPAYLVSRAGPDFTNSLHNFSSFYIPSFVSILFICPSSCFLCLMCGQLFFAISAIIAFHPTEQWL